MGCENYLGREKEELPPRQQFNFLKKIWIQLKDGDRESISERILPNILESKGREIGNYFQTIKILLP